MNTAYDYRSLDPYRVLGLPRSTTDDEAMRACISARTAAGQNFEHRRLATEAFNKVKTDLHVISKGGRSAYPDYMYVPVPTFSDTSESAVYTPEPTAASAQESNTHAGSYAAGSASTVGAAWGPTVTGDVFEEGFYPEQGRINSPAEQRMAPGYASAEFLAWEREYNQVALEKEMHPGGKYSLVLLFFCIVLGIMGTLGSFWMIALGLGMSFLASTEAGEAAAAANPGSLAFDDYSSFTTSMVFVLFLAISLFFVPMVHKRVRRNRVQQRFFQLQRIGVDNHWL